MPSPAQPLPKLIDEPLGINAVLLGPPGSGKGTQVINFMVKEWDLQYIMFFREHCVKILCMIRIIRSYVECWSAMIVSSSMSYK